METAFYTVMHRILLDAHSTPSPPQQKKKKKLYAFCTNLDQTPVSFSAEL